MPGNSSIYSPGLQEIQSPNIICHSQATSVKTSRSKTEIHIFNCVRLEELISYYRFKETDEWKSKNGKADFSIEFSTMRFLTVSRADQSRSADGRSGAQRRQCLVRKAEYNPAEVRSADFRNAKYSGVASPYAYGGSHFNYSVFPATSFSDHLRCPYAIHSLQGRDKLRLAST